MEAEYLIDGYNLLMARFPRSIRRGPQRLERARSLLLQWLAARFPKGTAATVVFDARDDGLQHAKLQKRQIEGIDVVFSGGYRNADELIFELCQDHHRPRSLRVVSNDSEIRRAAKKLRCQALTCDQFEELLEHKATPKRTGSIPVAPEKPEAPSEQETAHWLKAFADAGGSIEPAPKPAPKSRVGRGPGKTAPAVPPPKIVIQSIEIGLEDFLREMLDGVRKMESEG